MMQRRPRGEVPRADVDTGPRNTAELEAAVADKPNLVRKLVMATLPGAITSLVAAIVSAVIGFVVLQGKVGAQDLRIDRIEEQRRGDSEQVNTLTKAVAQLAETQAHVVARIDSADAQRTQFWQVHWPALMTRLDRTDSKIDSLIEAVTRRSPR